MWKESTPKTMLSYCCGVTPRPHNMMQSHDHTGLNTTHHDIVTISNLIFYLPFVLEEARDSSNGKRGRGHCFFFFGLKSCQLISTQQSSTRYTTEAFNIQSGEHRSLRHKCNNENNTLNEPQYVHMTILTYVHNVYSQTFDKIIKRLCGNLWPHIHPEKKWKEKHWLGLRHSSPFTLSHIWTDLALHTVIVAIKEHIRLWMRDISYGNYSKYLWIFGVTCSLLYLHVNLHFNDVGIRPF